MLPVAQVKLDLNITQAKPRADKRLCNLFFLPAQAHTPFGLKDLMAAHSAER
jgi:hypothetical protein